MFLQTTTRALLSCDCESYDRIPSVGMRKLRDVYVLPRKRYLYSRRLVSCACHGIGMKYIAALDSAYVLSGS